MLHEDSFIILHTSAGYGRHFLWAAAAVLRHFTGCMRRSARPAEDFPQKLTKDS